MRARAFLLGTAMLVLHSASQAQQPTSSTCKTSVTLVPGGAPIPLKSTAATVATLDSAALSSIAGRTLSDALTARLPGVSVMRSSGVTGTGSRISIRGPGGLTTPQRPIVFIDGIRVDDNFDAQLIGIDPQAPSRLDDIPLDAISCVQVLRGPAAAAAYGTDAAGGVILVTTRVPSRGQSDPIGVSGFADYGNSMDGTAYPLNFIRTGTAPNTQLSTLDPLRTYTPFRVGRLANVGGSISATPGRNFSALIRGSTQAQDGSLGDNNLRRYTGGAALTFDPTPNLSLRSRVWLIHSDLRLPDGRTLLASALLDSVPLSRAGLLPVESQHVDQTSKRFGGGIDAEWRPAPWLVARAALGREDSRLSDIDTSPLFERLVTTGEPVRSDVVQRNAATARTQRTSGTTSISAAYGPERVRSTTTLAFAYASDVRHTETHAESHSLRDTTLRSSADSRRAQGTGDTRAITVRQTLAWDDRRFVELGARHDDISKFLFALKNATYPFVGATWHLSKEQFFPAFKSLSTLRLRAAYGEAGDRRDYDSDLLFEYAFIPIPGSTTINPTRPVLRSRELESGLDVGLFDNRLGIEATWYRKRVSDAPHFVPGPATYGFTTIVANDGAWVTEGTELAATVQVFETALVRANLAVAFSALRNKVLRTCFCRTISGPIMGYPLTSSWAQVIHFSDNNSNGVIDTAEVTRDTTLQYVGSSTPTRELGLVPSVTIAKRLSIAAVLDYRAGFVQYNETESARCRYRVCAELFDRSAPMQDQARAVAGSPYDGLWFEPGDFVRVREVNVTWDLPSSFARRLGAHGASLGVAGRNLATWTKYSGLDPEVSNAGQASFIQRESFTLPLARTFSMRLDMRW